MAIITDIVSVILYDITSFKSVCKSGSISPFCVCEKSKTRLKDSHEAQLGINWDIDSAIISWKHRHQGTLSGHMDAKMNKTWLLYWRAIPVQCGKSNNIHPDKGCGSQRIARLTSCWRLLSPHFPVSCTKIWLWGHFLYLWVHLHSCLISSTRQ